MPFRKTVFCSCGRSQAAGELKPAQAPRRLKPSVKHITYAKQLHYFTYGLDTERRKGISASVAISGITEMYY